MTREEAKEELIQSLTDNYIPDPEAVEMAIKALEQEPCDALDKIRTELIKWIDMPGGSYEYDAGLKRALTIIDKYREGKVIEQTELLHRQI